jgi:hypothetical protein
MRSCLIWDSTKLNQLILRINTYWYVFFGKLFSSDREPEDVKQTSASYNLFDLYTILSYL